MFNFLKKDPPMTNPTETAKHRLHYFPKYGLTIAAEPFSVEGTSPQVRFDFAECGDLDQFSRKVGRNVAEGRLTHKDCGGYYLYAEAFREGLKSLRALETDGASQRRFIRNFKEMLTYVEPMR
jgi:hypothetical protein